MTTTVSPITTPSNATNDEQRIEHLCYAVRVMHDLSSAEALLNQTSSPTPAHYAEMVRAASQNLHFALGTHTDEYDAQKSPFFQSATLTDMRDARKSVDHANEDLELDDANYAKKMEAQKLSPTHPATHLKAAVKTGIAELQTWVRTQTPA